jgi:hypothetical protein
MGGRHNNSAAFDGNLCKSEEPRSICGFHICTWTDVTIFKNIFAEKFDKNITVFSQNTFCTK